MDHRHLHPNEFDLLLDGDIGFGVAPLKAHVRSCAQCRAELDEARRVVALLEELPHLAPSPLFADRVMAHVQVFEPWHVTARDTLRRLVPASRPARVLAAVGAVTMALLVWAGALSLLVRLDTLLFTSSILLDRGRTLVLGLLADAVGSILGPPAVEALATGGTAGIAGGTVLFLATLVAAALLLRALTRVSRRRRV